LAKLVEVPKEGPLDVPLVASKLGESVPLFGVVIERASEKDLVPVSLVFCLHERLFSFLTRGFVRDYGSE
jgi:hypothetical protein